MSIFENKVLRKIKDDEQDWKLNQLYCELEPNFLYMGELYEAASILAIKYGYKNIIDLGCYMAAQSFLFEDYDKYIGVDCYDSLHYHMEIDFKPPKRFITKNTKHYQVSIEDFLDEYVPHMDLSDTLTLVSAVPSATEGELHDKILKTFPAVIMWYPGCGYSVTSPVNNNGVSEIMMLAKKIKDAECPYNNAWKKENPNKAKIFEEKQEKLLAEIALL